MVKSSLRGTTSDAWGNFSLPVPDNDAVLVFSFVGYATQEVTVENRNVLTVRLPVDDKSLYEVKLL